MKDYCLKKLISISSGGALLVGGVARNLSYATLCASGVQASIAASILERGGFEEVALVTGGLASWTAEGYPLEDG